jgi:hypothetical protein
MIRLREINGTTHFASYELTQRGWRRVAVYRVEGRSDNSLLYYFRNVRGNDASETHKRGAAYCHIETFRPFAIDGGKSK